MNEETVKNSRDRYLAANSLSVESYGAKNFPLYLWKSTVYIPNPGFLHFHDLHHVVTGYGTGLVGEAEISAYELRGGYYSTMILVLCLGAILIGIFISPKRIWRAWKRAKGAKTLYHTEIPYEKLLEMRVADLRAHLGVERGGYK
ncbi:MAG TPA: Coq4 family protein [Pyrinomonadaceae bacterium]|jgi:ubiquinone biosynthesis protein Coq4